LASTGIIIWMEQELTRLYGNMRATDKLETTIKFWCLGNGRFRMKKLYIYIHNTIQ